MTMSLYDHTSDPNNNYYWSCLRKVSINARTTANLNEIMLFINQNNYGHAVNLVVGAYLEILKSSLAKKVRSQ